MNVDLVPLGDRAFLARFETEAGAIAWHAGMHARLDAHSGVTDVVLAYRSVAVYFDPERCDPDALAIELRGVTETESDATPGLLITLPVLYDGPDLAVVAANLGMRIEELIAAHTSVEYHVFALGFMPGFPYAGYLPDSIAGMSRRAEPRKSVPAGSVAIAGRQTGVYPQDSPGGWHLIGRTPLVIADLRAGHFPVRAGDRLKFVAIDPVEYVSRVGEWLEVAGRERICPVEPVS